MANSPDVILIEIGYFHLIPGYCVFCEEKIIKTADGTFGWCNICRTEYFKRGYDPVREKWLIEVARKKTNRLPVFLTEELVLKRSVFQTPIVTLI